MVDFIFQKTLVPGADETQFKEIGELLHLKDEVRKLKQLGCMRMTTLTVSVRNIVLFHPFCNEVNLSDCNS